MPMTSPSDTRRCANRTSIAVAVLMAAAAVGPIWAGEPLFIGLGTPDGAATRAVAVSADGSTVVGNSLWGPFVWTRSDGPVLLGEVGVKSTVTAGAVSGDGSIVVGSTVGDPFIWTASTGMSPLDAMQNYLVRPYGISADGTTVVGEKRYVGDKTNPPLYFDEAFVWTAGQGMVGLGTFGGPASAAYAVSGDGTTVVGYSVHTNGLTTAALWRNGAVVSLGSLSAGPSYAYGVSSDGLFVVGESQDETGLPEAFLWNAGTRMIRLGSTRDLSTVAYGVSADGSRVVGEELGAAGSVAMLWEAGQAPRLLHDVLRSDVGLDLSGWTLQRAVGISADGNVIAGTGLNPQGQEEAWVAIFSVPEPEVGELLDDLIEDVLIVNTLSGITSSLDAKLDNAVGAFSAENAEQRQDAINKLEAFINSVEAQRGRQISEEDAAYLTEAAGKIINKASK